MIDLPREIWLHVANFIKPSALEDLIGLNSTFYNLAMDCRYRQISFAFLDNKMMRNIVRLKDPVVAKRVRVLHVYPGFLNQVLDNARDQGYSRRPFRSRLTNLANQFMEQKIFVGNKKIPIAPKFRAAADVIQHMLDVFSDLPNVTDYRIMWCGLRAMSESPVPLLTALFQPNLCKLSLDISLENVVKLFADHGSTPSLANVEELNLVIRLDHCANESVRHTIMKNHLAPVISRLRGTLRQLVIQTWEPLDLCPFFCAVLFLPHLERLTLGIPIESPHLGDPNGISTFLQCQSSTLRSLSLRATQNSGPGLSSFPSSFNTWISCALEGVRLPNLRDLSISSRLFPFPAALTCLERLSATITSLALTGSYHTHADIVTVLGIFKDRPVTDRLETLRLGSVALTPQLLDLLAEELPRLYQLELLIREVAPENDEALSIFPGDRTTRLDNFFSEMEKRIYFHWGLCRFKYTMTAFPYHIPLGHLQELFLHSIPTIRGFS